MKNFCFITMMLTVAILAGCAANRHSHRPGRQSAAETETLIVANRMADCMGVAPQKCLQIKRSGSDGWEYFYSPIAGFDYQPGYEYIITVAKYPVANPPMDSSSIRYELVDILSKTPAEYPDQEIF